MENLPFCLIHYMEVSWVIGVPLNHPFLDGILPNKNQPDTKGYPHVPSWTPPSRASMASSGISTTWWVGVVGLGVPWLSAVRVVRMISVLRTRCWHVFDIHQPGWDNPLAWWRWREKERERDIYIYVCDHMWVWVRMQFPNCWKVDTEIDLNLWSP